MFNNLSKKPFIIYIFVLSIVLYNMPLIIHINNAQTLNLILAYSMFISTCLYTLTFKDENLNSTFKKIIISNLIITLIGIFLFKSLNKGNLYFSFEEFDDWAWEGIMILFYMTLYTIISFCIYFILTGFKKILSTIINKLKKN